MGCESDIQRLDARLRHEQVWTSVGMIGCGCYSPSTTTPSYAHFIHPVCPPLPHCARPCPPTQDTVTLLAREKERLEQEERLQLLEQQRLQRVAAMVERCQQQGGGGGGGGDDGEEEASGRRPSAAAMSLDEVEAVYRELSTSYREEYAMYNLAATAAAQVWGDGVWDI